MLLGHPGPSSVHAFAVFNCGVLFGFLHFGILVAPAVTGSGNKALLQQLTLDDSNTELTYQRQPTIC